MVYNRFLDMKIHEKFEKLEQENCELKKQLKKRRKASKTCQSK